MTTRLHEVSVVGVKQQTSSDLSASTSVDAAAARRYNVQSMKGMSEIAPNFYIPDYGSRMTSSIYVRGLGARTEQSAVGLNVDGVPMLSKDSYDFYLMDISGIEVFRGAQAVLNGRNAIGGQINIKTLSPWQYRGVRAVAEYGRFNTMRAGAGWYGLLSPVVATSVTAQYHATDGAYRNTYNGARVGNEHSGSARWKVSYHPATSRFTLSNTFAAGITRQGGYPYEQVSTGQIAYNDTCFYRRNTISDAVTIGWAGRRVIVSSVTSVQYIDDNMTLDQDFTTHEYFTLAQTRREWAITQDLFAKGHRGAYSWLGGVFGFYRHSRMSAPVTFKEMGVSELIEKHANKYNPLYPIRWNDREFVLGSDFGTFTRDIALYHQSRYRLGEFLFEGGLRLDVEHVSMSYLSHCDTGYDTYRVLDDGSLTHYRDDIPVVINENGHLSHTYVQLLPKLAVAWEPAARGIDRVYVSASKGYKAGGFNTQMFSDVLQQRIMSMLGIGMTYDVDKIVSYKPEQSWDFEFGARASTADRRLTADMSLFLISCRDLQLTMFPDGSTTGRITTNAGRTRNSGVEVSLRWQPVSWLRLRGDYGYTRAVFRKYHDGKTDYRGKTVPYAPENTLFLSAGFTPDTEAVLRGGLAVETYVRGVGRIWWNEDNTLSQPFYATLGASLTYTRPRWSVKVWGENLTDTRYNTFYFKSMEREFVNRARPMSVGVTVRVNLGE